MGYGLHVGYENRAERALRDCLGDDYLNRKVSRVMYRPWVDVPNDVTGAIEHQPIPRMAVVIEGEADEVAKLLAVIEGRA